MSFYVCCMYKFSQCFWKAVALSPNVTHKFSRQSRALLQMVWLATSEFIENMQRWVLKNHCLNLQHIVLSQPPHFAKQTTQGKNGWFSHLPMVVRWTTHNFAFSDALFRTSRVNAMHLPIGMSPSLDRLLTVMICGTCFSLCILLTWFTLHHPWNKKSETRG